MKSILSFVYIIILVSLASCSSDSSTKGGGEEGKKGKVTKPELKSINIALEKIWSSEDGFITPESVIYDKKYKVYYVANVNENPWQKDGNGFISKMDTNGKILNLKWITDGMNAPKGMGIIDDKLYVTDIDELLEIDIPTGNIARRYAVTPGSDLNDVTIGDNNDIYISASGTNLIYRKRGTEMTPWTAKLAFRPNGVFYEKGHLNVLGFDSQKMYKFDLIDNTESTFSDALGSADGVEKLAEGGYLTSDWNGQVFYVNPSGKSKLLINTKAAKKGAADIEYVAASNILLVPTFFDNHVDAYKVVIE